MKKLLGILGLCGLFSFSVLFAKPQVSQVRAEETQVVEVVEDKSLTEEISQTCKDCIAFIKEFLSQPLVIAGVSTTVGALALLIISKAVGGISKKKLKETSSKIDELSQLMLDSVSKKDFNSLVSQKDQLVEIIKELLPIIKNVKLKENLMEQLNKLEPIKEEVVEFAKEEHDKVVEDVKKESVVVKNDITEILKQD